MTIKEKNRQLQYYSTDSRDQSQTSDIEGSRFLKHVELTEHTHVVYLVKLPSF